MSQRDGEIRELFARNNVPLDRDDVWAVQGTPVVKHKAVERLGAALGIEWLPPQVLRAERDEAVILATGKVGSKLEWSIGEALIVKEGQPGGNYKVSGKQAAYPFAMSEKRARDRVILKLAGLQGVYSEEEADEFKGRDEPRSDASYGNEPITKAETEHLVHLLQEAQGDPERFCRYMNVPSIAAIPASQFDRAVAAIATVKKKKQNGAAAHA